LTIAPPGAILLVGRVCFAVGEKSSMSIFLGIPVEEDGRVGAEDLLVLVEILKSLSLEDIDDHLMSNASTMPAQIRDLYMQELERRGLQLPAWQSHLKGVL
jgi:hypothetical protein